jgi:hypothetical protein
MKIGHRFILLAVIIGVTTMQGFAQQGIKIEGKKDSTTKTEWDITLDYYTRSVFLGRTDSAGSGNYMPAITVNLKSGFFFSLAPTLFQQNTSNAYSGLSLMAGYDKSLSDNFDIDIQLIKNFYPPASRRVNSTVTFEGEAALDYINDIITSEISPQFLVNKSTFDNTPDYVFTLIESHPFYLYTLISLNDSLSITPSASVSAGTQNFYISYVNTKDLAEHPKEEAALKKAANKAEKVASEAKILDYELSLPVSYYWGHLIITVTPLYSIGENIINRTTPLPLWSADFGIGYRFW